MYIKLLSTSTFPFPNSLRDFWVDTKPLCKWGRKNRILQFMCVSVCAEQCLWCLENYYFCFLQVRDLDQPAYYQLPPQSRFMGVMQQKIANSLQNNFMLNLMRKIFWDLGLWYWKNMNLVSVHCSGCFCHKGNF